MKQGHLQRPPWPVSLFSSRQPPSAIAKHSILKLESEAQNLIPIKFVQAFCTSALNTSAPCDRSFKDMPIHHLPFTPTPRDNWWLQGIQLKLTSLKPTIAVWMRSPRLYLILNTAIYFLNINIILISLYHLIIILSLSVFKYELHHEQETVVASFKRGRLKGSNWDAGPEWTLWVEDYHLGI